MINNTDTRFNKLPLPFFSPTNTCLYVEVLKRPNVKIVSSKKLDHYDVRQLLSGENTSGNDKDNNERIFVVEQGTSISLKCDNHDDATNIDQQQQQQQQQYYATLNNNHRQKEESSVKTITSSLSKLNYVWFINDKMVPINVGGGSAYEYKIADFSQENTGTYKCYIVPMSDGATVPVGNFDDDMMAPEVNLQLKGIYF